LPQGTGRKLPELMNTLKAKLRGHWNFYGVIGNSQSLNQYYYLIPNVSGLTGFSKITGPVPPGMLDHPLGWQSDRNAVLPQGLL
jgi:hypothetical protein